MKAYFKSVLVLLMSVSSTAMAEDYVGPTFDCKYGLDASSQKEFTLMVKGTSTPGIQTGFANNVPEVGLDFQVNFDYLSFEISGEVQKAGVVQETFPLMTASGAELLGSFPAAGAIECFSNDKEPSLDSMAEVVLPAMKLAFDDVKDLPLVTRIELAPDKFVESSITVPARILGADPVPLLLKDKISSADNLMLAKTKCVRYHREGNTITTVMCAHPTDDMKQLVIFKMGMAFEWDNTNKKWYPSIWGWEDGENPILSEFPKPPVK